MPFQSILAQALEHVPALLFTWAVIYAAYWLLGMVRWPSSTRRAGWLERMGSLDGATLDASRVGALVLISLVSLFMELLLVRWVASEIRVFAYFKSLVLIACFLGFGLGCYLTRARVRVGYTLVPLVAMVLLTELPWNPLRRLVVNLSGFIGWLSESHHIWSRAHFAGNGAWGMVSAALAMSVVIPVFGLIAISFVPLGQLVGYYLENAKRGVAAYSINVLASIAGIWLYTALCFLSTPPVVWFALLGAGLVAFVWLYRRDSAVTRAVALSFGVVIALFGVGTFKKQWWGEESWKGETTSEQQLHAGTPETVWSPYQKLTLVPMLANDGHVSRYVLNTNDSWFQHILDLRDPATQREEAAAMNAPIRFHQYNLPYQFLGGAKPARVLIAGGGMGNDAASAVRNGAAKVTVVEIDPLIVDRGRKVHLEHPYLDPKVDVVIDDARAFIENDTARYDLIVFSILDSHTTTSHYTNIRLDNYVYTVEAMRATRKLLKPDGLFVMSFSSERPWFTSRLHDVVAQGFGKAPLMIKRDKMFFVTSPGDRVERALAADRELAAFAAERSSKVKLEPASAITDDWPYLYQQHRSIPAIIWILSLGLIGVCSFAFRRLKGEGGRIDWHMFFLGAAFMLLEVQVISKTALLFGTTWLVNSIVITALLGFILLANLVVAYWERFPRPLAYVGLFATLAVSYLVPAHAIFFPSMLARGAAAMALYCSPVFFAGLVFISSFREAGFRAEAFGSNLLGSLVGGLLDSLSFAIGLNALVLVAAALYACSLLTMRRARSGVAIPADVVTPGSVLTPDFTPTTA